MDEWEIKARATLKEISGKLQEFEKILKDNGIDSPFKNYKLENNEKIQLPWGYIRTAEYFRRKYHLYKLLDYKFLRNNIAYAFQATDFYNYLLNRFYIGLSVGKIFYKSAIINNFSIFEGILYGVIKTEHKFCLSNNGICRRNDKCSYYLKAPNKYTFVQILELLTSKNLLVFNEKEIERLIQIKTLRDNIHIWDAVGNDLENDGYNLKTYNQIVLLLKKVNNVLPINITEFKKNRNNDCSKINV
ncbi:MAG TPA: hypothetical protein PLT92_13935 [Ignavibacteriaceae bacterium]|nr:hypothetical protein [Ignavibacteriaceae bacterium]